MGMVKCEIHGLSGATQCCAHIVAAKIEGIYERAFVAIDGWNNPDVLCARCYAKALELASKNRRDSPGEPFIFDFGDGTFMGSCVPCLDEWFVATGQGRLSDAEDAARAR